MLKNNNEKITIYNTTVHRFTYTGKGETNNTNIKNKIKKRTITVVLENGRGNGC